MKTYSNSHNIIPNLLHVSLLNEIISVSDKSETEKKNIRINKHRQGK